MKTLGLILGLLLPVTAFSAQAECFDLSGDRNGLGFLECKQHSWLYNGKIEPTARDYLVGIWSTDCSGTSPRLHISAAADGTITTVLQRYDDETKQYLDPEGGPVANLIDVKIIGNILYTSTVTRTSAEIIYNSFASQVISPNKRRFIEDQGLSFGLAMPDQTAAPQIKVSIRGGIDLSGNSPRDTPIIERCAPPRKK